MQTKKSRDRLTYVLIAVIIVMAFEIIYLIVQNRMLKGIIADPMKYFHTLSEDETVPSFTARDVRGDELSVNYAEDGPYTMLFWFGATCSSCEDNIVFWKNIYKEYNSERMRMLGMFIGNPGSGREFADNHQMEFPVICATQRYLVDLYKGHILPQTMLVAPEGVIRGIWPGILDEQAEIEITAILQAIH